MEVTGKKKFKGELHSNYTFLYCLNWPRMGFYKSFHKNEFGELFFSKLTFQHHLQKTSV